MIIGETGAVACESPPFPVTAQESQGFHATPLVIAVRGEDQLVFMSPTEVIGLGADPSQRRCCQAFEAP